MFLNNLMTFSVLAVREDGTYTPFSADAWLYAGQMTLLGMLMVFCVLAILWAILAIFKLIFAGKTPKAPKAPKEPKIEKKPEPKVSAQPVSVANQSNDAELVAILTAAVAVYMAEQGTDAGYNGGFRVVSFKRVRGGRTWNS